jgi:hypothetical protein
VAEGAVTSSVGDVGGTVAVEGGTVVGEAVPATVGLADGVAVKASAVVGTGMGVEVEVRTGTGVKVGVSSGAWVGFDGEGFFVGLDVGSSVGAELPGVGVNVPGGTVCRLGFRPGAAHRSGVAIIPATSRLTRTIQSPYFLLALFALIAAS